MTICKWKFLPLYLSYFFPEFLSIGSWVHSFGGEQLLRWSLRHKDDLGIQSAIVTSGLNSPHNHTILYKRIRPRKSSRIRIPGPCRSSKTGEPPIIPDTNWDGNAIRRLGVLRFPEHGDRPTDHKGHELSLSVEWGGLICRIGLHPVRR